MAVSVSAVASASTTVQSTLYELGGSGSGNGWFTTQGGFWFAQSITTGTRGGKLTNVSVYVRNANNSDTDSNAGVLNLELYSSVAGAPGTSLGSIATNTAVGAWGDGSLAYTPSIDLAASTQYFVVFKGTGTVGWKYDTADSISTDVTPTPAFLNLVTDDSGSSWSSAGLSTGFILDASVSLGTEQQTIELPALPPISLGGPTQLPPTTTGGLPIVYESNTPAVCTVSGAVLTPVTTGTCTITATQPGNADIEPATPVTQSVEIVKAQQSQAKSSKPSTIKSKGTTVINRRNAKTVQGQPLRAAVAAKVLKGDVECYRIVRGAQRKVSIVTTGLCKLRIRTTYTAPGTDIYHAYQKSFTYRTKATAR